MKLIILDLVTNSFDDVEQKMREDTNAQVLALTPSAFYYLESREIKYISFHKIISTEKFRNDVLTIGFDILKQNESKFTRAFSREILQYVSQFYIIENIVEYIKNKNYNFVIFITDRGTLCDEIFLDNKYSLLARHYQFDEIVNIERKTSKIKKLKLDKLKRYLLSQIVKKIINLIQHNHLRFDWDLLDIKNKRDFGNAIVAPKSVDFDLSHKKFKNIEIQNISFEIKKGENIFNYLTFLESHVYVKAYELYKTKEKLFFFQHGSYLYKNIFLKYAEIELATINFVFNDYTKKLFEELGAKKVYSVGSILFNKPIKERIKEYDFLYITQGHDYSGNFQYVDFPNSLHSFDGYELYQRHKKIIKLFGEKFRDKKIIIRVHPTAITNGVYVPFWELAKPYSNVIIDVSMPIHNLIEKSKYIISDYFTSEFINRELHYKRDIILFQGAPTPLPEETIEDMKKMFILVDTVDDLEKKVTNIEKITKNRIRYDDIIEYYSSKKCDTKKVVTEILEKELNARN